MNGLDILISIILVIFLFIGLTIGLIRTVFSLIGLILAIFLAGRFYVPLADLLPLSDNWPRIVAYIIILLVVLIVVAVIAVILDKFFSAVMLGWLNRLGGAVFGVVLGGVFCAAVLAIWAKYGTGIDVASGSVIARFLLDKFPVVLALLPSEFNNVKNFFE